MVAPKYKRVKQSKNIANKATCKRTMNKKSVLVGSKTKWVNNLNVNSCKIESSTSLARNSISTCTSERIKKRDQINKISKINLDMVSANSHKERKRGMTWVTKYNNRDCVLKIKHEDCKDAYAEIKADKYIYTDSCNIENFQPKIDEIKLEDDNGLSMEIKEEPFDIPASDNLNQNPNLTVRVNDLFEQSRELGTNNEFTNFPDPISNLDLSNNIEMPGGSFIICLEENGASKYECTLCGMNVLMMIEEIQQHVHTKNHMLKIMKEESSHENPIQANYENYETIKADMLAKLILFRKNSNCVIEDASSRLCTERKKNSPRKKEIFSKDEKLYISKVMKDMKKLCPDEDSMGHFNNLKKLASKAYLRQQIQTVVITDERDEYLFTCRDMRRITIPELSLFDVYSHIKDDHSFDQGTLFVVVCGIYSIVGKEIIEECLENSCSNPKSIFHNLDNSIPNHAMNLHRMVLNNTTNDKIVFLPITAININDFNKTIMAEGIAPCTHSEPLREFDYQIYKKQIVFYKYWVQLHNAIVGFKDWNMNCSHFFERASDVKMEFLSKYIRSGGIYLNLEIQEMNKSILMNMCHEYIGLQASSCRELCISKNDGYDFTFDEASSNSELSSVSLMIMNLPKHIPEAFVEDLITEIDHKATFQFSGDGESKCCYVKTYGGENYIYKLLNNCQMSGSTIGVFIYKEGCLINRELTDSEVKYIHDLYEKICSKWELTLAKMEYTENVMIEGEEDIKFTVLDENFTKFSEKRKRLPNFDCRDESLSHSKHDCQSRLDDLDDCIEAAYDSLNAEKENAKNKLQSGEWHDSINQIIVEPDKIDDSEEIEPDVGQLRKLLGPLYVPFVSDRVNLEDECNRLYTDIRMLPHLHSESEAHYAMFSKKYNEECIKYNIQMKSELQKTKLWIKYWQKLVIELQKIEFVIKVKNLLNKYKEKATDQTNMVDEVEVESLNLIDAKISMEDVEYKESSSDCSKNDEIAKVCNDESEELLNQCNNSPFTFGVPSHGMIPPFTYPGMPFNPDIWPPTGMPFDPGFFPPQNLPLHPIMPPYPGMPLPPMLPLDNLPQYPGFAFPGMLPPTLPQTPMEVSPGGVQADIPINQNIADPVTNESQQPNSIHSSDVALLLCSSASKDDRKSESMYSTFSTSSQLIKGSSSSVNLSPDRSCSSAFVSHANLASSQISISTGNSYSPIEVKSEIICETSVSNSVLSPKVSVPMALPPTMSVISNETKQQVPAPFEHVFSSQQNSPSLPRNFAVPPPPIGGMPYYPWLPPEQQPNFPFTQEILTPTYENLPTLANQFLKSILPQFGSNLSLIESPTDIPTDVAPFLLPEVPQNILNELMSNAPGIANSNEDHIKVPEGNFNISKDQSLDAFLPSVLLHENVGPTTSKLSSIYENDSKTKVDFNPHFKSRPTELAHECIAPIDSISRSDNSERLSNIRLERSNLQNENFLSNILVNVNSFNARVDKTLNSFESNSKMSTISISNYLQSDFFNDRPDVFKSFLSEEGINTSSLKEQHNSQCVYSIKETFGVLEIALSHFDILSKPLKIVISKCKELGSDSLSSLKYINTKENINLFAMVIKKLMTSQNSSNSNSKEFYGGLIERVKQLVETAKKSKSFGTGLDLESIVRVTKNQNSEFTMEMIKTALAYEGVVDPSLQELNSIYSEVCLYKS